MFLEPDFAYYRSLSRQVMSIVRSRVEQVEVVGLDEAYLELTGLPAPKAEMRLLCTEITRGTGLGCSVGIGPNKLVAKVASDAEKPRGFVVLTREQARERFGSAPCGIVPGIGPKTAERLLSQGVRTLAELAAAPEERLGALFGGRTARELRRRACFEDDSPVSEERKVVSESRETTFDRDISDMSQLEEILERLTVRLCETLVSQRRCGRTIGIKVRLDDFSTHTRARTLPGPVSAAEHVMPVAIELLRRFAPSRPVRLLGVRVAGLEQGDGRTAEQLSLAV